MNVPTWAGSMLSNYRDSYRALHGETWKGSDVELWEIIEEWKDLTDPQERDTAVLSEMKDNEDMAR